MMPSRIAEEGTAETGIDLRDVLASIARRKWLVASVTLAVVLLAGLWSYTRTPLYTATADVLVRPILTSPLETNQSDTVNIDTEIRIATSASVANLVSNRLDTPGSVTDLLDNVSVTVPGTAQILEISYTATHPADAQQGAQAFAEAYLEFKTNQAVDSIRQRATSLQSGIDDVARQIAGLNKQIVGLAVGTPDRADLIDQRTALETTRLTLQNQLATVTSLSIDPGLVIQPAERPTAPSQPRHKVDIALGLLLGLLSGSGIAIARQRLADSIDRPSSLELALDAPVLGVIPKLSAGQKRLRRPVTVAQPKSHAAEAFRMLRTNMLASGSSPPVRTLLVTSAWPREGKTTVATNLAASMAQLGREVVLISADLRFPRAHSFFGLENKRGLGQVLGGGLQLERAIQRSPIPHLRVLPSGPVDAIVEPVELISSDAMSEVIARCAKDAIVIIDGAPILAVADSLVVATLVDAVLFVADARKGRIATLFQSRYQLRQVGANLMGGVLSGMEGWKRLRGGYGAYDYDRGLLSRILTSDPNEGGDVTGSDETVPPELRKHVSA